MNSEITIAAQALNASFQAARENTFAVTTRIRAKASRDIRDDNGVVLAAFVCDVAPNLNDPLIVSSIVNLIEATESDRQEACALVNASSLFCAAVRDNRLEDDARVLAQIANFLGSPLMVERCRLLVESRLNLTDDQFIHLLSMTIEVQQLLAHPELLEGKHNSLEDVRREEAIRLASTPELIERIKQAPTAFVLSHEPRYLADAVHSLMSLPSVGGAHVHVSATTSDTWIVRIVTHDTNALLARITDALHASHLNIVGADLATWPDGVVLDTFTVTASASPSASIIEHAINARLAHFNLDENLVVVGDALAVECDNVSHPINSVVYISGPDQPGLLSKIATAFARCDISVHHAVIETNDNQISDRFEVTDLEGLKLAPGHRDLFISLLS